MVGVVIEPYRNDFGADLKEPPAKISKSIIGSTETCLRGLGGAPGAFRL